MSIVRRLHYSLTCFEIPVPIGSMHGIFTSICYEHQPYVYIGVNSVSARCLIAAGLLLKASHRKRTAWEALGRALLSNLHW